MSPFIVVLAWVLQLFISVPGGELFDAISLYRGFSEDVTRNIFIQLFRALKYLHDRGISHRGKPSQSS